MKYTKELYGKTSIDSLDSEELDKDYKIELEYYQIKDETADKPYGIEVVKRYKGEGIRSTEEKEICNICNTKNNTNRVLDILISNKVTPVALEDVLHDFAVDNII